MHRSKLVLERVFQARVSKCYDEFVKNGGLPQFFEMDLNVGYLKNYISDFVAEGIAMISTNEIKSAISDAFHAHARVAEARTQERYQTALKEIPTNANDESESESDIIEEIFSTSSSEEDQEPLVLKLPLKFKTSGRTNLSINRKSK